MLLLLSPWQMVGLELHLLAQLRDSRHVLSFGWTVILERGHLSKTTVPAVTQLKHRLRRSRALPLLLLPLRCQPLPPLCQLLHLLRRSRDLLLLRLPLRHRFPHTHLCMHRRPKSQRVRPPLHRFQGIQCQLLRKLRRW